MKLIAISSFAAAMLLVAPAQAMPGGVKTVPSVSADSAVHAVNMRVSRTTRSSAGSSSCLLCSGLGVGLGNLLGANLNIGIAQSQSYVQQSSHYSAQRGTPQRHGHHGRGSVKRR